MCDVCVTSPILRNAMALYDESQAEVRRLRDGIIHIAERAKVVATGAKKAEFSDECQERVLQVRWITNAGYAIRLEGLLDEGVSDV